MATTDAPSSHGLSVPGEAPRRAVPRRRSVRIRGREYPVLLPSIRDPRLHVAAVLLTLQVLGQTVLNFRLSVAQILICLATGALIEFGVGFFNDKVIMWPASGLLTGNSTAFILRVPGTVHGQWWSKHGFLIFIGVVAIWHATALCGRDLWQTLVTSPEVLIFAFFMLPDPRTVPDGQVGRFVFGVIVAVLSVLLLGPTTLEFWTKTALLASLVFACAGRFALVRLLAPLEEAGGPFAAVRRLGWTAPAVFGVTLLLITALPVSAQFSTHSPEPAPELPDGSTPKLALTLGSGPDVATWLSGSAGAALPPPNNSGPVSASARVWVLPPIPAVSISTNVIAFDPSMNAPTAKTWAHDVVLDLVIESEARRLHDLNLAESGAEGDALTEFTDVIKPDIAAGTGIPKRHSFDRGSLNLFLPKFSTQARRLIGVTLHGTTTLVTRDASGKVVSQQTQPYAKSGGVGVTKEGTTYQVISANFTDLTLA